MSHNTTSGHEAQEAAAVGEDLLKNGKLQPTI